MINDAVIHNKGRITMSFKEKNLKSQRYFSRSAVTGGIKKTRKRRVVVSVLSVAIAAVSITGICTISSAHSGSGTDILAPGQFKYDKNDYAAASVAAAYDDRVNTNGFSVKAKNPDEQSSELAERPVVKLNKSSVTFKELGKSVTLKPEFSIKDAKLKYSWKSKDEKIAKVDKNGKVTPVKNGTVKIICTEENSGASAECTVKVDTVLVKGIRLSITKAELNLNDTKTIRAKVTNKTAANTKLKWSSSDESVATVNSNGKVKAVSAGTAAITCAATDGSGVKKTCKVKVNDVIGLKEIYLNYIDIQFSGLGCTEQLELMSYSPDNATNTQVVWSSTDENVAVVDENGVVYPVDNGNCDIVATATDGSNVKASCPVTVSGVVNYVEVAPDYTVVIPPNVNVNETAKSVIEEAEKYVGWLPYVWGGVDLTSGVDCSGFICAVYQKFGYNLWGIRTELINAGREVSLEEAQPGDIIVYRGHVALYDGNGGKIHAPTEGYMVTHDYGLGNYISIRRVIE